MSINYYNQNATAFHADTANVDMSALYAEFLPLLPAGAHIIDAGCGSGRDALAFAHQGFQVTAFDASPALVEIAQAQLNKEENQPIANQVAIAQANFNSFAVASPAHAIWACASLLHVPLQNLSTTFMHLAAQLQPKGVFYCSFKYGDTEVERGGRTFTNLNEALLEKVIAASGLGVQKTWVTGDARPGRADEKWLNAVLVKG